MTTRAATWPSGVRVVWRSLTWGEFREIRAIQATPAERALVVYQTCLVEGPPPELILAGIMMWICMDELENSPFSGSFQNLSLPLEESRNKIRSNYLLSAQAFIASVFKIPFEDMNDWDADTLLTRLAQAEFVSGVPLNPVDPKTKKTNKKAPRPSKLTETQRKVMERSHPEAVSYNTKDVIDHGEQPSQLRETERSETFTYTR